MLECVVNVSEGRDADVLAALRGATGDDLLDVHSDPDHHRSVFTVVGEHAPRALARVAVERLDLAGHDGAHPRMGVADVVPFVPLGSATVDDAVAARDRFCRWAAGELALPCFAYGPERSLPDVRRSAFSSLAPVAGPPGPHPTAGATAVGARPVLVAYNLWLVDADLERARDLARALRSPEVRALGLRIGAEVQVSMNLVAPDRVGPAEVWDRVASEVAIGRAELVGLVPEATLHAIPRRRWDRLDLDPSRTIEARLAQRFTPGGR